MDESSDALDMSWPDTCRVCLSPVCVTVSSCHLSRLSQLDESSEALDKSWPDTCRVCLSPVGCHCVVVSPVASVADGRVVGCARHELAGHLSRLSVTCLCHCVVVSPVASVAAGRVLGGARQELAGHLSRLSVTCRVSLCRRVTCRVCRRWTSRRMRST